MSDECFAKSFRFSHHGGKLNTGGSNSYAPWGKAKHSTLKCQTTRVLIANDTRVVCYLPTLSFTTKKALPIGNAFYIFYE